MTCILLGYTQNHMGVTYRMLNLCTKHVFLRFHFIWLNKTHGEYVSILEHTKAIIYILQDEDDFNKWAHIKIDASILKTSIPNKMLIPIGIIGWKKI